MSIYYDEAHAAYTLSGGDASLVLCTQGGELTELYRGARIPDGEIVLAPQHYNGAASFDTAHNNMPWAIPTSGRGYYGTPALRVRNAAGDDVTVLKVVSTEIFPGKPNKPGLPHVYTECDSEAQTLIITLADALTGLEVKAQYTVFEDSGAIAQSMVLKNASDAPMTVEALMAASVPLFGNEYDVIYLQGGWARERSIIRTPLNGAKIAVDSLRGASGHEHNPFLAICERDATEFSGGVYGLSLVYSGSFLAVAEADNLGNARASIGFHPGAFTWYLAPNETLETPEVVVVYSAKGLNGMSQLYHALYRRRLARGAWRDRVRPILINNWEATYFDFDEEKIFGIARDAQSLGIELFVLDDGWFGKRNLDNCSLGDWVVNREKLPDGMGALSDKIHEIGMQFGLWFEPEMISPDSDLYRAHPDWCLHVEGRERTEQRNQLILDMGRAEVQDYVIRAVSDVLSSARIDYVKWDMNRNMTEAFSAALPPERKRESQHRYMLGLYRVMEEITRAFPEVLFESCSGGGGRFDPGMLYYMPQTWTSDDTDAAERLSIQYGTSMVYPVSAMGAHVSAVPNHQTGRTTPIAFRGAVALAGNFGFELDLRSLSDDERACVKVMVEDVKKYREITQKGTFTRLCSPFEGLICAWQFVSEDESEALVCIYRIAAKPMAPVLRIRTQLPDESARYAANGEILSAATLNRFGIWADLQGDFASKIVYLKKTEA